MQGCPSGRPLEHCPGQTDAEYRTEFSIWSITASNLLVSTDIRNMTDIMKQVRERQISHALRGRGV